MKKIVFAALLAAMPLALAACGTGASPLVLESNWYKNTSLGDNIEGTYEELVYSVATGESTPRDGFSAEYRDGVYTTKLTIANLQLDNSTREGYVLETTLSVGLVFTAGGENSPVFTETATSRVEFLPVSTRLSPVKSEREVHCHAPASYASSVENCYTEYHYKYTVEYDDALTKAQVTYTDILGKKEPQTTEYALKGNSTYLDNEEIMFALRGVSGFSTFRTFNTTMRTVQNVSLRANTQEANRTISYLRNGEQFTKEDAPTYEMTIGYGDGVGVDAKLLYAGKTLSADNESRNVLLSMDLPVLGSLGTIRYTLKEATFNDK